MLTWVGTLAGARVLDERLRFLTTARTRVQRCLGQGLASFYRKDGLLALCYSSKKDYLRERLGLGEREAQELVSIEQCIGSYPETERLWNEGRINRCQVREIMARVAPEDDFVWARLAAMMTVRQLKERLADGEVDPDERGGRTLEFDASPALRELLQLTGEVVNAMLGRDVGVVGSLEACAMEWFSTAQPQHFRRLETERFDTRALRAQGLVELAQQRSRREAGREVASARWRDLPSEVPEVFVPTFTIPPDATVFDIDGQLQDVVRFGQEVDSLLMQTLVTAFHEQVPAELGFDSLEQYGRERLGMSPSSMWSLLRLGKALRMSPEVREAYQVGTLSRAQAQGVLRVATPRTVSDWIRYGARTTVRQLKDVVQRALLLRREDPCRYGDLWPPDESPVTDVAALALLQHSLAAMNDGKPVIGSRQPQQDSGDGPLVASHSEQPPMGGLQTCTGQVTLPETGELQTCADRPSSSLVDDRVRVPDVSYIASLPLPRRQRVWVDDEQDDLLSDALALCRFWFDHPATVGDCIEIMVVNFLRQYQHEVEQAIKEHPVIIRDGWRCGCPGCTRRDTLQSHHLDFRSHGGSDADFNRSTLCVFHHLRCLHEGRLAAAGTAPGNVAWALGIRPDGLPTEVFANETRLSPK